MSFIRDVIERDLSNIQPSDKTDFESPASGFPTHKKRYTASAFKQKRNVQTPRPQATIIPSNTQVEPSFPDEEKRRIDSENRAVIENMSPDEIATAQKELLSGLSPSLVQKLLSRANLDEQSGPSPFDSPPPSELTAPTPQIRIEETTQSKQPPASSSKKQPMTKAPNPRMFDEDLAPAQPPANLFPITDQPSSTHFPTPRTLPDLDPSDPNFLETLRQKYFPETPADPSKLAWMAPIPTEHSIADRESPYYPDQSSISTSSLRFDFRGVLLPPRVSRAIPVSKGLHHHGLAPEAAGYTIAELAMYARSAVPAQRCIAFQTVGRILYRLGQGEWGAAPDDPIAMGIWASVKEGRIIDSLTAAATEETGHRGSRAYATEALWLLEKGGWKEKWSGR